MALRSIQPLAERVPGVFPEGKGGRCVRLTTLPPSCAVVMKSVNLNFLEPSGTLKACNGTALPYPFYSRLGGPQGRSGRVRKISPPPGFDPGPGWNSVPSWSCSKAVYRPIWHIPLLSVQWMKSWWWTKELSETCRVSRQNKFVKLVHLVGFIIKEILYVY
jgi:hypothetical protein